MVIIRFLRIGRKHQPSYRIVAVDSRQSPKSGKYIEQLGFYNPLTKEKSINKERAEYWLSVGAQVSDTVHNFLVTEGIVKAKKKAVHSVKKKKKEAEPGTGAEAEGEAQKPAEEPKAEEPKAGESEKEKKSKPEPKAEPEPKPKLEPETEATKKAEKEEIKEEAGEQADGEVKAEESKTEEPKQEKQEEEKEKENAEPSVSKEGKGGENEKEAADTKKAEVDKNA